MEVACPFCGGSELVITSDGDLVCARCGTVISASISYDPPKDRNKLKNVGARLAEIPPSIYRDPKLTSVATTSTMSRRRLITLPCKVAEHWFNVVFQKRDPRPIYNCLRHATSYARSHCGILGYAFALCPSTSVRRLASQCRNASDFKRGFTCGVKHVMLADIRDAALALIPRRALMRTHDLLDALWSITSRRDVDVALVRCALRYDDPIQGLESCARLCIAT